MFKLLVFFDKLLEKVVVFLFLLNELIKKLQEKSFFFKFCFVLVFVLFFKNLNV